MIISIIVLGTGKSFLLSKIVSSLKNIYGDEKVAVTATTGIAAININGITLHSFAGVGLGTDPVEKLIQKINYSKNSFIRWKVIKALIVDEVSMLDGELFDKLEAISRSVHKNNDPFGNILLVLSGDFLQLPPVPSNGVNYKFCFEAASWNRCINVKLQLSVVFRQKESALVEMLNEIRMGFVSQKTTDIMNKLINPPKYPDDGILVTEFYHLEKLKTKKYTYYSIDYDPPRYGQIQKLVHNCLALHKLELKRGSQVMLVKNIRKDLVNGSRGVIIGFYSKTTKKKYYNGEDEHVEFDQEDLLPIVKFTKNREEIISISEWNLIETIETDDIILANPSFACMGNNNPQKPKPNCGTN
ncbi:3151_t:CDS:2 [Entrophospora sp. SA101]|nr:3151_t:CDS:2 [Entrophospora sp. SA101]